MHALTRGARIPSAPTPCFCSLAAQAGLGARANPAFGFRAPLTCLWVSSWELGAVSAEGEEGEGDEGFGFVEAVGDAGEEPDFGVG